MFINQMLIILKLMDSIQVNEINIIMLHQLMNYNFTFRGNNIIDF